MKYMIKNRWIEFHPRLHQLKFKYSHGGYFDSRAELIFSLSFVVGVVALFFNVWVGLALMAIPWGETYINLPFNTGIYRHDPPQYGLCLFGEGKFFDNVVIHRGETEDTQNDRRRRTVFIRMPWAWEWVRTSYLCKVGVLGGSGTYWLTETPGNMLGYGGPNPRDHVFKETFPYKYVLKNGKEQNVKATVSTEEREWRWRWFMWLPVFGKISRTISVEFSDEVGERAGSWKGGVLGCGYDLRPGETPEQALRRMEKEQKF